MLLITRFNSLFKNHLNMFYNLVFNIIDFLNIFFYYDSYSENIFRNRNNIYLVLEFCKKIMKRVSVSRNNVGNVLKDFIGYFTKMLNNGSREIDLKDCIFEKFMQKNIPFLKLKMSKFLDGTIFSIH